jgi:hypothetical protein
MNRLIGMIVMDYVNDYDTKSITIMKRTPANSAGDQQPAIDQDRERI